MTGEKIMTNKERKQWNAEKKNLSIMATAICGQYIPVKDVEMDAVGYTSKDGAIHLAYDNDLFKGLKASEKAVARRGICAHEILHKVKTDFDTSSLILKSLPMFEQSIYATLDNIVEDCAIETQADDTIGGLTLDALDFIIAHTYKQSDKLETFSHPYVQLLNAMIQFGDMGVPKGHFTFPEAKKIFYKITPIFKKAIEEPLGAKRCQYSKEIFELTRPLWEAEVKEQEKLQELLEKLKEFADKNGITATEGKGTGTESGTGGEREKVEKKKKRQKLTIELISEEEKEQLKKEMEDAKRAEGKGSESASGERAESGCEGRPGMKSGGVGILGDEKSDSGTIPDGDITLKVTEEDLKKMTKSEEKKDSKGSSSGISMGMESSPENKDSSESQDDDSMKAAEKNESSTRSKVSNSKSSELRETKRTESSKEESEVSLEREMSKGNPDDERKTESSESVMKIDEEEYEIDEEAVKSILDNIEKTLEEMETRMEAVEGETLEDDIQVTSPYYKDVSCLNKRVNCSDSEDLAEGYQRLVSEMSSGIKGLINRFSRIFINDQEEIVYKNAGKVDIKRMNNGKVTARVFDKRREPNNRADTAVFLLIDESGSMRGEKDKTARNVAISFAEVFAKLNIPLYIMGFTADTDGYKAVHNHYISWKNTLATRIRLMDIQGRCENFDGYSIRYATEILKKKSAANKLLIIVSDGAPACSMYSSRVDGVADTKDAIKNAKKIGSVIGVGIGNVNKEIFTNMYGNDFLHIANIKELYTGISQKLVRVVKGWE